jgi:eukaryotic-like serine/threonine-protein kinase
VTPTVRLRRPLAEGGMGRVWIAEHAGLATHVVVKTMSEAMAARPDGAERFAREAAAAAAIKSPHVVQVFDHGVTPSGVPYIVMELLEGRDLGAYLEAHGPLGPDAVVALVVQLGKVLSRAHRAGIVHRDIKPENIFLCETEHKGEVFVKLLDFGTARSDRDPTRATIPGQIMGTPHYMSPEQSVGSEVDATTDVWSLGVVAYEALTGKKPFEGPSVGAIAIAIHGPLPTITQHAPWLPPGLDGWFARACARTPEGRFASVREATHAFVEAATGIAPPDAPTESMFMPPVRRAAPTVASESARLMPITRTPIGDTLPPPGAGRRGTAIAAGIVMATAALAMVGIVVRGRHDPAPSPPPVTQAEVKPSLPHVPPPEPRAVSMPPAGEPTPAPAAPEATPAPLAHAAAPAAAPAPSPSTVAAKPPRESRSATRKADAARTADPAPLKARTHRHAKEEPALEPRETPKEEDDLVRLQNAAAHHAPPEPQPAPEPDPLPHLAPSPSESPSALPTP